MFEAVISGSESTLECKSVLFGRITITNEEWAFWQKYLNEYFDDIDMNYFWRKSGLQSSKEEKNRYTCTTFLT